MFAIRGARKASAIALLLTAQLLSGCNEKGIATCNLRYILVLDRTTKFDSRSRDLFRDGVRRLFSNTDMSGEFYSYEIRSTGLGYTKLVDPILIPRPMKEFVARRCTGGVYDERYEECMRQNENEKALSDKRVAERDAVLRDAQSRLIEVGMADAPAAANTVLSEALENIVQRDCIGFSCVIFLMSDLIEPSTRQIAHSPAKWSDTAIQEKVRAQPLLDRTVNVSAASLEILIWGVGRDEVVGRELGAAGKSMLVDYWKQLLLRLGFHDNLMLQYEFPDISKLSFGRDGPGSVCESVRSLQQKKKK
jgi:hypothetical protein